MARQASRVRAWDLIWSSLDQVVRLSWPIRSHTEKRDALATTLDQLRATLTIEEAHLLSDAVLAAYELGALDKGVQ